MSLKGSRYIQATDISFFMDQVATRGGIAVASTVGSGAALDQSAALVQYANDPSGTVPMGVLLSDMVNIDLTKYKLNQHQEQVQQGGKVTLMTKGWVLTDQVEGAVSGPGDAYVGHSGKFTPTWINNAATPWCGTFKSTADEDGFVKVEVNLPAKLHS